MSDFVSGMLFGIGLCVLLTIVPLPDRASDDESWKWISHDIEGDTLWCRHQPGRTQCCPLKTPCNLPGYDIREGGRG